MKKITILMIGVCLFLSSCANLFSPPFDARLAGTWTGATTNETTTEETDVFGNTYIVATTESVSETYTFHNDSEVKKEHSWSKDETVNGFSTGFSGGNGTSTYEWKNFTKSHTIDFTNIESGKIKINGFELTKQ